MKKTIMDNDPLKEFVLRNRDAFDDLELPPLQLDRVRLVPQPVQYPQKGTFRLRLVSLMPAAAAVILVILGALLFFAQKDKPVGLAIGKAPYQSHKHKLRDLPERIPVTVSEKNIFVAPKPRKAIAGNISSMANDPLTDSSSVSNRLTAIFNRGYYGVLSKSDVMALCKTLDYDASTNVRFAAFDKLRLSLTDKRMKQIVASSIGKQENPMMQFEMISFLSDDNASGKSDVIAAASALASNLATDDAVRDQAMMILMKQHLL